jgi:hypothetical protein
MVRQLNMLLIRMAFALRRPVSTVNADTGASSQVRALKYRALNAATPLAKNNPLTDTSVFLKLRGVYCNCQNQPTGQVGQPQ